MSRVITIASAGLLLAVSTAWAEQSTETPADSRVKELSVAPLDHIEYPESRPEWLSDPPVSQSDIYRMVVVSGPCDTVEESEEELRVLQRAAVSTLVIQIARSDGRFDFYSPSDEQIERDLVKRRYSGEITQGDQTRYEHAVEIEFSEVDQRQVREAWHAVEVRDRLGAVGLLTFSGLTLLVCGSAATGLISRRTQLRENQQGSAG
jgi:hypothetical protein